MLSQESNCFIHKIDLESQIQTLFKRAYFRVRNKRSPVYNLFSMDYKYFIKFDFLNLNLIKFSSLQELYLFPDVHLFRTLEVFLKSGFFIVQLPMSPRPRNSYCNYIHEKRVSCKHVLIRRSFRKLFMSSFIHKFDVKRI